MPNILFFLWKPQSSVIWPLLQHAIANTTLPWQSPMCFSLSLLIFLKRFYLFIFRKRGRGRESSMCGCVSHTPNQGPSQQPRPVPWLGIEPATLWFTGRCSIHWATPARDHLDFLFLLILRPPFTPSRLSLLWWLTPYQPVSPGCCQSIRPISLSLEQHWHLWCFISDLVRRNQGAGLGTVFIKSTIVHSSDLGLHIHSLLTHWLTLGSFQDCKLHSL